MNRLRLHGNRRGCWCGFLLWTTILIRNVDKIYGGKGHTALSEPKITSKLQVSLELI